MGLIILAWAIPGIYSLVNTYYIGQMELEAIAISEQYEYVAVLLEILLEMFPIAVLALVAHNFNDAKSASDVIRAALPMQLLVTIGFMVLVFFGASLFVDAMNVPSEIASRTEDFLRVKVIAIPFESMAALYVISIKAMRRGRLAVLIAVTGVAINVILDTMMISDLSFSFRLGIMGSAWDYVISKILMLAIAMVAFYLIVRERPSVRFDRKMCEAILRIGKYTGLESAVRNAGYILGMLIVLNTLGTAQYGDYGVAMTILWMIFLIPVLALTEATNVAIGNEYGRKDLEKMRNVQMVSLMIMGIYMTSVAVLGCFIWYDLSSFFNKNQEIVDFSVATFYYLAIPYIMFALSSGLKSLFIGIGNTRYYLVPSAVVNLGIYIPIGIAVKMGYYLPSFEEIMTISFSVFAIDLLISALMVRVQYGKLTRELNKCNL
ncbi:MAG: hypothetical protein LLG16_07330 [Euryarchaeota archaeon]|nr:hypothetical protein [Euryarchaeota archaeon]